MLFIKHTNLGMRSLGSLCKSDNRLIGQDITFDTISIIPYAYFVLLYVFVVVFILCQVKRALTDHIAFVESR